MNLLSLEAAVLADNIPGLLEALLYFARNRVEDTPGWVTRKSFDLVVDLLMEKKLAGSGMGSTHLEKCRLDMMHSRRHLVVEEVRHQRPFIAGEKNALKGRIRIRRKVGKQVSPALRLYAEDRESYAFAISRQFEVAARLLRVQGDRLVSPSTVRRSYRLVEYGGSGQYHYPRNRYVIRALGLVDALNPRPSHANWELALLDQPFQPARSCSGSKVRLPFGPKLGRAPWEVNEPTLAAWKNSSARTRVRLAVQGGNWITLLNELHRYNLHGGYAPPWLMKGAVRAIVLLLTRKARRGRLSRPLAAYKQDLIDCERYRLIVGVWLVRMSHAAGLRAAYRSKSASERIVREALAGMNLDRSTSIERAIKEALRVTEHEELRATFSAAKKAFWAVRSDPMKLNRHTRPCAYVAKRLDLPHFGD